MRNKKFSNLIVGNKIIAGKQYSSGSVYILDMSNNMYCVFQTDNADTKVIQEKVFCYTDSTKKYVWSNCLKYFKSIKDYLIKGCEI